jgi:SHS2 domain-containing protein
LYQWVDHTGEVELAISAGSEEAIFCQACMALCELIGDGPSRHRTSRSVCVASADDASLLADWLCELVFLAEAEGFVSERVASISLHDRRLKSRVEGHIGNPRELVKAVTYHRLKIEQNACLWQANVVFDV